VSFILDALRKSEHERQRSAVPGLSQVPLATPRPHMPRWALVVMGVLVAAVLVLGGAWWQSAREPAELAASPPTTVERNVALPAPRSAAPSQAAPSRPLSQRESSLSAAASSAGGVQTGAGADTGAGRAESGAPELLPSPRSTAPSGGPALPSAAALAAEGVVLPPLRLELHAFSAQPRDRFVFINGRKYVEGERLAEGPQLLAIEPTGAVLAHAGRRFMLVQE
jgi:general secretion pathway protein B